MALGVLNMGLFLSDLFVFELHFHLLNWQERKGWAPTLGLTSGVMGRAVP